MSLQFGILGLLQYTPMTGYHLKKTFDKSVNHIWTASLSQIYRELGSLEKNGMVSSSIEQQDDRPDKKIYSITETGKEAFQEWLTGFSDKFISPKRDEFMLKIFFGAQMGKKEMKILFQRFIADREAAVKEITEEKKAMADREKLKNIGQIKLSEEDRMCMRFVMKRAVMTNELMIQWAEDCIEELNEKIE